MHGKGDNGKWKNTIVVESHMNFPVLIPYICLSLCTVHRDVIQTRFTDNRQTTSSSLYFVCPPRR